MIKPKLFAVSLVYYRWDAEPEYVTDEEGMPVGMSFPKLDIACVTGFSMETSSGTAIAALRAYKRDAYPSTDGWIEQISQSHEAEMGGWCKFTWNYICYWGRRAKRFLMW